LENWQFNEDNIEHVDSDEDSELLEQNNDDIMAEDYFQSFNLENIIHACSSIRRSFNFLNDTIKIIQDFNNLSIFDTNENYEKFTEGKEALETLMQSDSWKIAQNAFQNIQFYKKPTKSHKTNTNTNELVLLSPSKKQKRHESNITV
jgi:hypothetical protein